MKNILTGTGLVYRVLNKDIIITKGSASDGSFKQETDDMQKISIASCKIKSP